jgi:hypothetical protein
VRQIIYNVKKIKIRNYKVDETYVTVMQLVREGNTEEIELSIHNTVRKPEVDAKGYVKEV